MEQKGITIETLCRKVNTVLRAAWNFPDKAVDAIFLRQKPGNATMEPAHIAATSEGSGWRREKVKKLYAMGEEKRKRTLEEKCHKPVFYLGHTRMRKGQPEQFHRAIYTDVGLGSTLNKVLWRWILAEL